MSETNPNGQRQIHLCLTTCAQYSPVLAGALSECRIRRHHGDSQLPSDAPGGLLAAQQRRAHHSRWRRQAKLHGAESEARA